MSQYFSSKNVPHTPVILMQGITIVSGHMIIIIMGGAGGGGGIGSRITRKENPLS